MQTDILLKRLHTFEFLRGLDNSTLAALAESATWKVFPANTVVFWEGDVIERRRWTNQTELAARLGTVPDVLSRVIRELTRAGLIEMDKQHIRILDRAGLAERGMIQGE